MSHPQPGTPFDAIAPAHRARAFGVDYAIWRWSDGAELHVTREGWPWIDHIIPSRWFTGEQYSTRGLRQGGSTGTVYRVTTFGRDGRPRDLLVKFGRLAQDVPLFIPSSFLETFPQEAVANARFPSPFEEFGLLHELRTGPLNHGGTRILTKKPYAIFSPADRYDLWRTGRHPDQFRASQSALLHDQRHSPWPNLVTLDLSRDYLEIFGWVRGIDAEEACQRGFLTESDLVALSRRVNRDLATHGYRVLDNKPRHFILRPLPGKRLLRHHDGRLAYALVDFELLQRVEEHQLRRRPSW